MLTQNLTHSFVLTLTSCCDFKYCVNAHFNANTNVTFCVDTVFELIKTSCNLSSISKNTFSKYMALSSGHFTCHQPQKIFINKKMTNNNLQLMFDNIILSCAHILSKCFTLLITNVFIFIYGFDIRNTSCKITVTPLK